MSYNFKIALSFATEDQDLVEKVYHYLKAEKIKVFFAPSSEGQILLSGKNQREIFYDIFGLKSEFVALFVSQHYVSKKIPMEEASIAFAKHSNEGSVLPIYIDGTSLPIEMFNPESRNYFESDNPAVIANHLSSKVKQESNLIVSNVSENEKNVFNIKENSAEKQIFIQTLNGSIEL